MGLPAALVVLNALARHTTARTERREAIEYVEPALRVVKKTVSRRLPDAVVLRLPKRLQRKWIERYLERLRSAGHVCMTALKNVDSALITGQHSIAGLDALSPDLLGSPGSSLYLNLDRFDLVHYIMGGDASVAEWLEAQSSTLDLIRKDVSNCESAVKSIIFNSPISLRD